MIAHECKKWRDDENRPGTRIANGPRRYPVDSRLAPPRCLDDEGTATITHEYANRLELVRSHRGAGASEGGDDVARCSVETGLVDGRDPAPCEGGRAGRVTRQV